MSRFTAVAAVGLASFLLFAAPAAASPPTISYSVEGIAGTNGWYRGSIYGDNVVLHWSVVGATSPTCPPVVIPGPTTGTTETCTASNGPDQWTLKTTVKIDNTPPTVTASLSRKPDFHGWYNHPVTIRSSGTDTTSGLAGCSSVTYKGPENAAATVNGGCTDVAGNSAVHGVRLAYDATPPVLSDVSEQSTDGRQRPALELVEPLGPGRRPPSRPRRQSASGCLRRQRAGVHRREDPSGRGIRLLGAVVRPGRQPFEGGHHRGPAEGSDVAEDSLRTARGAEPDPSLGTLPRCRLLQRAALPRLEAHLLRVADEAPARPAGGVEMVRSPLPADTGAVPLVRLGRPRPPHAGALPDRRQREVRRSAPLGSSVLHLHRLCT